MINIRTAFNKYCFILIIITFIYLQISYISSNWGPFRSCGPMENEVKDLADCDSYSLSSGLGCCLVTHETTNIKECVLIGGKAQGFFNNRTSTEYNDLNNLVFPQLVANRTEEASANYTKYIKETYGSNSPKAIIRCANNNFIRYKVSYLVTALVFGLFFLA